MKKYTTFSSIIALSTALSATSFTASAADEDFIIEDIVVTATKRSERMKDVPISMSAMGSEQIDQTGVRDLKSIAEYIPNLQISQSNDFRSTVTIRGVGAQSRNIGFDARVGVYVDGVYMGQSPSLNQELLDLERVEVLRGPQGTLFGKNTVAGAINLVSKKPDEEFAGQVTADAGNLGYTEFKGMVNIPLSDKVFTKFTIAKADRDGYVLNSFTGNDLMQVDTLSYRAQIRFQVNDKLEVNASFDGLNSDALILVGEPLTDTFALVPVPFAPEEREVFFDKDPDDKRDVYGGHVDINYEFDNGFTIKSITGYRDTDAVYTNQTDYSPLDIVTIKFADRYKQLTEEIQFISPDDEKFTYMVGLYYYDQEAQTQRDANIGADFFEGFFDVFGVPGPFQETVRQTLGFGVPGVDKTTNFGIVNTKSYAAYFNGVYEVTDKFKIGFGMRYSVEDKDVNWTADGRFSGRPLLIPDSLAGLPDLVNPDNAGNLIGTDITSESIAAVNFFSPLAAAQLAPFIQLNGLAFNTGTTGDDPNNPQPLINDRQDKFFAPSINLMYAVTEDVNIYAKYSSGYKSGGFNLDFINADELKANAGLEFDKETVDSFEVGFKGSFMDNRIKLNMAGFISNYDDYQVNQFVDLGGGRTSIRITNAAKVQTKGIEAEATWHATDGLTFNGSLGVLDATFDEFLEGGAGGSDVSGNRLPNATTFNAAFSAQYYHELEDIDSTLLLRADLTHRSGYFTTVNNDTSSPLRAIPGATVPFDYIESLTMINARIGLISNSAGWEVYLWGRNLTDQRKYVDDLRDFFGTIARFPNLPRTYGIEGVFNF